MYDWNGSIRSLNVDLPDDIARLKAAGYYQEAIARRLMKTDNVAYINAVLFGPLFLILQQHRQSGTPAVMSEVEKVLDLSVSAVLKIR